MCNAIPETLTIQQRIARGRAIARLYIAAQHLSQTASDEACRLLEDANDHWQNHGFNQEMNKSPFPTRAQSGASMQRVTKFDLEAMTTPPWLQITNPVPDTRINDALGDYAYVR